ncbi:MAG: hypothetical protein J0L92_00825 [Deltaproteobacteria bacterium]|nr:hypothetical protein [Deltaproteobacteria bacterium]
MTRSNDAQVVRIELTAHQWLCWFAVDFSARTEFRADLRARVREALAGEIHGGCGPGCAEITHHGVLVERVHHDGRVEHEPWPPEAR